MADDHEGLDDDFDFDDELLLAAVEEAEQQAKQRAIVVESEDEFEDLDNDDLIMATETAERLHSSTRTAAGSGTSRQQSLTNFFPSTSSSTGTRIQQRPQQQQQQRQQAESSNATASTATSVASILMGGRDHETEVPPTPPPPPAPDTPCAHEFDAATLPTWVYPINYPVRLYQWNIVKKALFHNTLVALPTGLGKTFIAAVVMYNYWRWFPKGKVVFLAPTKPLVTQQVEACFNICGIPQSEMIEITGHVDRNKRKQYWQTHRVFFMTPQTMQNDLETKICPAHLLTCVVIDEAHKATGNYAYGEVIKLIAKEQNQFRVLALTATPGTNLQAVQTVVSKLHITQIQIRTEDSMDIQEHAFGKQVQHVLVQLEYTTGATGSVPDYIRRFRDGFFKPVLERLSRFQAILSTDVDRNSNFNLLQSHKHFTANSRNFNNAVKAMVAVDFSIAMAMARCYERLCFHGVGPFLDHLEEFLNDLRTTVESGKRLAREKQKLLNDASLKRLIEDMHERQSRPGFMGHPKMEKMVNIILQHLSDHGQDTRVMVFSTYRSSVDDIVRVLSEHEPMVRCSLFVGQAGRKDGRKGLNQREQQEIVTKFKKGQINVLVATSIGEEGLDIGEVDLIICYDSQSSPIRMLQRMGRTGRKRRGRCVMIMTEQEENKFKNAKASYAQVQNAIARGGVINLYSPNPSVLPENYQPVWRKMTLTIGTFFKPVTGKRKRRTKVVDANGHLIEAVEQEFLMNLNVGSVDEAFEKYWPPTSKTSSLLLKSNRYLPRNTELMPTKRVGHSIRSKQFVKLVSSMEQRLLNAMVTGGEDEKQEEQARLGDQLIIPFFDQSESKWLGDELILPTPVRKMETASKPKAPSLPSGLEQASLDSDLYFSDEEPLTRTNTVTDIAASASAGPSIAKVPAIPPPNVSDDWIDDDLLDDADLDILEDAHLVSTPMPPQQGVKHPAPSVAESSRTKQQRHDNNTVTFLEFDFDSQQLASQPAPAEVNKPEEDKEEVQLEFDFSTQAPESPGGVSHGTASTDYEQILPPELSASAPIDDDEEKDSALIDQQSVLSTMRRSQQQTPMDGTNISPAMLQWLTSRPTFTKTAKVLLCERMDIVKIRTWIDDDDGWPSEQQQPRQLSAAASDRSVPSFDDFDIDESILEALENIPVKQHTSISCANATFNQVLENKMDEDTSIVYTSIIPEDARSPSPSTMAASPLDLLGSDNNNKPPSPVTTGSPMTASPMPLRCHPSPFRNDADSSFAVPTPSPARLRQKSRSSIATPLREDEKSVASSLSPSPLIFRRRKRMTIAIDDEDDSREGHSSIVHVNNNDNEDDTDDETRSMARKHRRDNIFLDLEAELSTDEENQGTGAGGGGGGAHQDDSGDNESDSDLSRYEASFIDDGSSDIAPHIDDSDEVDRQDAIYRASLMSQQPNGGNGPVFARGPPRRKTWLDRFEAEKWMTPQEDDEVIDDIDDEEGMEESIIMEDLSDDFL